MIESNPFIAHAESMGQYREETLDGTAAGAGIMTFKNGQPIPVICSVFEVRQILREDGGGFVPSLMGNAIVQKDDLPSDFPLRSGQALTITPPIGVARECQIVSWDDCFTFWNITVQDVNENI